MDQLIEIEVRASGVHAFLADRPVSRKEFETYLHAVGRPLAPPNGHSGPPGAPVTGISQVDADAYVRWMAGKRGTRARLPTTAELIALLAKDELDGFSPEIWPHEHGARPEVMGGLKPHWLCEWTSEMEEIRQGAGRPARMLGAIFYPPWLREGGNASFAQARLSATEGYSFVTFRLARDP